MERIRVFDANAEFSHGFNHFLGAMRGNYTNASALPPSRQDKHGKYAEGQFNKITGGLSYLQRFFFGSSFLFEVDGQYSSDLLTS